MGAPAATALILGAATLLAACDVAAPPEASTTRSFDRPPVQVGTVAVTSGYSDGVPTRVALTESALTNGIETSSSFEVYFDRFLWPRTVSRQAVCLHPATKTVATIADCVDPAQPFTEPEYNPVRRSVTYRLAAGARLKAATQYRFTVFPSVEGGSGFQAFDGAPLARSYAFDFTTKNDSTSAIDELPLSKARYCAARSCAQTCAKSLGDCKATCKGSCANDADPATCQKSCTAACGSAAASCKATCGCLDGAACGGDGELAGANPYVFRTCAYSPCHAPSFNTDPALAAPPPMGLDLSTADGLLTTAIHHVAHLTQTGEAATIPDLSGGRFGRAMPLIDPSNPGNSFVLYTLLINDRNFADEQLTPALRDDIERLRATVVPGIPMPAPSGPDTNRLNADGASSQADMQLISDWIAAGAVTSCD